MTMKKAQAQSATAKPICEVCGLHEATSISYFRRHAFCKIQGWKLACGCASDIYHYYIYLDDFFKSEESKRNWIEHLSEKLWVNLADFMQAVERCGGVK
jgi:hypothetical protein